MNNGHVVIINIIFIFFKIVLNFPPLRPWHSGLDLFPITEFNTSLYLL